MASGFDNPADYARIVQSRFPRANNFMALNRVQTEASVRVNKIFQDWTLLNHIINRHESTIQRRWLKKSRQQRKTILLTAWPNMSVCHRPDLEVFFREHLATGRSSTAYNNPKFNKDPYFWPAINQEDLLKPKLLLVFLNARARHFPSAFAEVDCESIRFALTSERVSTPFLIKHTMMFTGRNTPETYGELYAWKDHEGAEMWLETGRGFQPGVGLQILEIQERVYHFLLECCLQILQDMPRESLGPAADNSPVEPEPPALSLVEVGGVNSLANLTSLGPYRSPASLNLGRLYDLVAAKYSDIKDHIWSLREDPNYFADVLKDIRDHRQETLPDFKGRQHSLMRPDQAHLLWNRVFEATIGQTTHNLVMWNDLQTLIGKAMALQEKYKSQITYKDDLPEDLLETLLELEFSLHYYIKAPVQILQMILMASPPVRSFFARVPEQEEGNNYMCQVGPKPAYDREKTLGRVMWIFRSMWNDELRYLCGESHLLDDLDRLVENDYKAKKLFSSLVTSELEDLALLTECQRQIQLYQPWASSFEHETSVRKDRLFGRLNELNRPLEQNEMGFKRFAWPAMDPSSSQFFYPVDKRRTKETTEAMQSAERNLDAFWQKVDSVLMRKLNGIPDTPLRQLLEGRTLQRTPDWVEPDLAFSSTAASNKGNDDLVKPLSQLHLDNESKGAASSDKTQTPKSKVKTRGLSSSASDPSLATDDTQPLVDENAETKTIMVDKKALKVFSTLFHQPSSHSQPGEIHWTDFLYAMTSVGFAVEKLYGSVWLFTPSNTFSSSAFERDVWERNIQFHEPHPIAKIPFWKARGIGRRLFRAYGWNGNMFKLEDV